MQVITETLMKPLFSTMSPSNVKHFISLANNIYTVCTWNIQWFTFFREFGSILRNQILVKILNFGLF